MSHLHGGSPIWTALVPERSGSIASRQRRDRLVVALSLLLAKERQRALAQQVRIAFAGVRKLNDPGGDDLAGDVGPVGQSKRHTSHFERDAHHPFGLGIETMALEIRRDRHALSSRSLAGERNLRLILQFLTALSLPGWRAGRRT